MPTNYDFSGWATRSNIQCSDGRIIADNAFADNDGQKVPLVWSHDHNNVGSVLGHALLENRGSGVYAYCSFNNTDNGRYAKKLVEHGDIESLSIYANQLQQDGAIVSHGNIREVSLVLAGANPGAYIENVMSHSGTDIIDSEAIIYPYENAEIKLVHSDEDDENKGESEEKKKEKDESDNKSEEDSKENEENEENKKDKSDESDNSEEDKKEDQKEDKEENKMGNNLSHAADNPEPNAGGQSDKTIQEIFNTLNEEQKEMIHYMLGRIAEEAGVANNEGGEENMKHNVFEGDDVMSQDAIAHDAMTTIIADAKRCGSLKESVIEHADEYGITNIEYLFPDAQKLENVPGFIKKVPDGWVKKVMNGTHHTPFSRIKMVFADITEDEARARGYTKGNKKIEEVFSLLKRTVDPTTIYKKQKLDRDDIIDITDFDVVSWLKTEMRMMLDEEIARAILFGDGRLPSSDDKIDESKIIPIVKDDDLYTITVEVEKEEDQTWGEALIDAAVLANVDYQGSGNKSAFMRPEQLAEVMLIKDGFKHRLYKDVNEVATAMLVKSIDEVPKSVMTDDDILAVIVDLSDYNVGADKGGSVNMFEDFDIDYNQQKYLIETRCSGALTKPYSAIVLKKKGGSNPSQS